MVKLETIIKAIEKELDETVKCPASKPAKNIGKTGSWNRTTTDYGATDETISYEDGTQIRFVNGELASVTYDGETIPFNNPTAYEIMENEYDDETAEEDKRLFWVDDTLNNIGTANYPTEEFVEDSMDLQAPFGGTFIDNHLFNHLDEYNKYVAGNMSEQELQGIIDDYDVNGQIENLYLKEDSIREYSANNDLSGADSFVTVQNYSKLPNEFNKDKHIVTNQKYEIEEAGSSKEDIPNWDDNGWTVITVRENGNHASTGYPLSISPDGGDVNKLLTEPGHKNERVVIDEKNKLIVQKPHKP